MTLATYSKPQDKVDILNRSFAPVFAQDDFSPPEMENNPISIPVHGWFKGKNWGYN